MILVPPLAVIRSSDGNARNDAMCLSKEEADTSFFYSAEGCSEFLLYKVFPECGGKITLGGTDYVNIRSVARRPKIRILIVVPSDVRKSIVVPSHVRAVKIAALVCQTAIGIEMSRYKRELGCEDRGDTITFEFDSSWDAVIAQVPMEKRTYSGGSTVGLSGPITEDSVVGLPSHGFLKVNKSSAELYRDSHLSRYINKCVDMLGIRDPNNLLFLTFVLSIGATPYGEEQFESFRDLCIIKSAMVPLLPTSIATLFSSLTCLDEFKNPNFRSLLRVVEKVEAEVIKLNHTIGGAVSSFYGAVLHELGHLFKLPHSKAGVMGFGGDNIQKLFVLDEYVNFAVQVDKFLVRETNANGYLVSLDSDIKQQLLEDIFDPLSIDLLYYSNFVNWRKGSSLTPIHIDLESHMASSTAGIIYVLYNANSKLGLLKTVTKYNASKTVKLRKFDCAMRISIVASDGNFLSILV